MNRLDQYSDRIMADVNTHAAALIQKAHPVDRSSLQGRLVDTFLKNNFISVHFDENGQGAEVTQNGEVQLKAGSLVPYILYQGSAFRPAG